MVTCKHCGQIFAEAINPPVEDVCEACFEQLYRYCACCRMVIFHEDGYEIHIAGAEDVSFICAACQDQYRVCVDCGDTFSIHHMVYADNGRVCETCCSDNYTSCDDCHEYVQNTTITSHGDLELCSACYQCACDREEVEDAEYDDDADDTDHIHSHDYKPSPYFYEAPTEKKTHDSKYYGIELEVERDGHSVLANPNEDYFYYKNDGSLDDGHEVVSHPATWDWLQANKAYWSKICAWRSSGYLSGDTETCGMHVHMSRAAFSTFHLYKVMRFFYDNPQFILKISRRKSSSLQQWAALGAVSDLILKVKVKYGKRKFEAINLCNKHTIEFRIFKGTLNPITFWANLEFLESLYHYTKDISARATKAMSVAGYKAYVDAHKDVYPNIHTRLINMN